MRSTKAASDALQLLGLELMAESMPADHLQAQRKLVGIARAPAAEPQVYLGSAAAS